MQLGTAQQTIHVAQTLSVYSLLEYKQHPCIDRLSPSLGGNLVDKVYTTPAYSSEFIDQQIERVASDLYQKLLDPTLPQAGPITFLVLRDGAQAFATRLFEHIYQLATRSVSPNNLVNRDHEIASQFSIVEAKLASYSGTSKMDEASTLQLPTHHFVATFLTNRNIIVIDDIQDSGKALNQTIAELRQFKPSSISACLLLQRHDDAHYTHLSEVASLEHKFVGIKHWAHTEQIAQALDISNEQAQKGWFVGRGMDLDDIGRDLASIYMLKPKE